jgi:PEGA domain
MSSHRRSDRVMIEDDMRRRSTRTERASRWLGGPVLAWALACAAGLLSTPDARGASPPTDRGESTTSTGTIEVQSSQGAQVSIDGASRGEVPVLVSVPAGEHRIEVTSPGHHPWRATVEVRASAKVSVKTDLVAIPTVEEPVVSVTAVDASPTLRAPAGRGVFLPTKKEHGLLTSRRPTVDASALRPLRGPTTEASVLLRTRRRATGTNEAGVFLPAPKRRVLLPSERPSDRATGGDVFLPKP